MARVRISTTVDRARLQELRDRLGGTDSAMIDRALVALLDELERKAEDRALTAHPYEGDADLAWDAPAPPSMPYDGDVPPQVIELARRRRARQR